MGEEPLFTDDSKQSVCGTNFPGFMHGVFEKDFSTLCGTNSLFILATVVCNQVFMLFLMGKRLLFLCGTELAYDFSSSSK
jgi:hypothetical protein